METTPDKFANNNQSQKLQFNKTHKLVEHQIQKKHVSPYQNPQSPVTPKKQSHQRIFVQTPQAVFIPISQKRDENITQFERYQSPKEEQIKSAKIKIFDVNTIQPKKQVRQVSTLSVLNLEKRETSSNVIKSKASISLKKQRISQFFYYQNFIVCKGLRKVIVYNLFTKCFAHIPINEDQFLLTPFAPYIFNCITGQYLNLYSQNAVEKYIEIERKRQSQFKKNKNSKNTSKQERITQQAFRQNLQMEKSPQFSAIQVVTVKISKLQVQCICKHSQSYFMGGYNRSVLPGGKRSQRRQVYELQHIDPKINNKPINVIKLQPNQNPVSIIQIQMPYLIVYCKPKFYLFGLKTHELLLTFTKEINHFFLLQGRYAFNVINGVGISYKNNKSSIFTFDLESSPIYGVEITEHKQEANCLCMQKTGRIFGSHKSALFEYIPNKRITRCVKLYSQSETILRIESTPSNNLLVLRQTQKLQYVIEAFTIDQSSITDF